MKNILQKLVWPLMAMPALYLLLVWEQIPAIVPMQYNLRGEVVREGSRNELILFVAILVAVNVLTYLLLLNVHRIDPKKNAEANRARMKKLATGISLFMTGLAMIMIYYGAHPQKELRPNFIILILGFLFAFIGNHLHSIKPNYFAGFRLPWTLENADNWKQTHALGGKLWFGGGLLIALLAILAPPAVATAGMGLAIAVMVIIPIIFSYRYFKKHRS